MTINDQIRDKKLQHDINREAAKISALSSGKIHKYEYLNGENNEDQGKTQIKAIQDQWQVKSIEKYVYHAEDTPLISKQKKIFNEIVDERLEKIVDLDKKVSSDDLIYKYKGNTADAKFDKFDNALNIINKIQNAKTSLSDVKNNQEKFKLYIGEIKRGNSKK